MVARLGSGWYGRCQSPPLSAMSEFLTVKEAAQKTGKSSSSIRRVIYPIVKDDSHPDRHHIQPTPAEARELRLQGENFPWRLSEELIEREISTKPASSAERVTGTGDDDPSARALVELLQLQLQHAQQQLQVKDQQISSMSEITKSLNERLREGNILMGSLQRQMSLGTGSPAAPVSPSEPAETTPKRTSKKPSLKKPAPKKRLWSRMFG